MVTSSFGKYWILQNLRVIYFNVLLLSALTQTYFVQLLINRINYLIKRF